MFNSFIDHVRAIFRQILSKSEGELPADEVVERVMRKGREKRGLDGSKSSVDVLADLLFSDSASDAGSSSSSATFSGSSRSSSGSDSEMNNNIDAKEEENEVESPSHVLRDEEVLDVAGEVEISRGESVAAGEDDTEPSVLGSVACGEGDGRGAEPAIPAVATDDEGQRALSGEDVKVS